MTNSVITDEMREAAVKAADYLQNLARDYNGRLSTTEQCGIYTMSLYLDAYPGHPDRIGWLISSSLDEWSRINAMLELADSVKRYIV